MYTFVDQMRVLYPITCRLKVLILVVSATAFPTIVYLSDHLTSVARHLTGSSLSATLQIISKPSR